MAAPWRALATDYTGSHVAVETLLGEYAEKFNGEDPLLPKARARQEDACHRITQLREEMVAYIGAWELPEPSAETLDQFRHLEERALAG